MLDIYILLGFLIVGTVIAIELKDLLSSVVALAAVGLGLSMSFIVLKAPDVAITQLVVETLSLIILIRATLKTDLPFSASGRWFFNTLIYIVFIVTLLLVGLKCFPDLPPFGEPVMRVTGTYIKEGLLKTGAANVVASVVLDYRAFDSLCEATVLFTAVIGVMTLLRRVGRKKEGETVEEDE